MPNIQKGNKPKPQQIDDSVVWSVELNPEGFPFMQWHIESDKPVHVDGIARLINGVEVGIAYWETGCTGFGAPKDGAWLDTFASTNPPLEWAPQAHPVSGDAITYRFWASLGTIDSHTFVYGAPMTVVLP